MTKSIRIPTSVEKHCVYSQVNNYVSKWIEIKLDLTESVQMVLPLMLLRDKHVENIKFIFENLDLSLRQIQDKVSSCSEVDFDSGIFTANIATNALDYWISFLLRYYRDGKPNCFHKEYEDHIDLEFDCLSDTTVDIVVMIAGNIVHPSDEALKILGSERAKKPSRR